ncbi:hypothetical protein GGI11_008365 [Coemansia sp. RSA 2049]|nr:hypothetical protein GGI11_008365 [Coemansia sp. RSA 2049]KAJ2512119.1 hypothetical protein H4217_007042 [Coemansia sp. RSA 1939]KAJ2589510.1 hypothetical protein EV177_009225 [Coemansia sp. RSA 1804]KAJ2689540.1 hypothetical protein GGH99_002805 [Coemansia sp. RSA 1285]
MENKSKALELAERLHVIYKEGEARKDTSFQHCWRSIDVSKDIKWHDERTKRDLPGVRKQKIERQYNMCFLAVEEFPPSRGPRNVMMAEMYIGLVEHAKTTTVEDIVLLCMEICDVYNRVVNGTSRRDYDGLVKQWGGLGGAERIKDVDVAYTTMEFLGHESQARLREQIEETANMQNAELQQQLLKH